MTRFQAAFSALILAQAAHSIEEVRGRLWESFPPARLLTGLVSSDRELAFLVLNAGLVAFGLWCLAVPVRHRLPSAAGLATLWICIEIINGIVHPLWTLSQGHYTPGVATAPVLLALALLLWRETRRAPHVP